MQRDLKEKAARLIAGYGIEPNTRNFGQHFLTDKAAISKFIAATDAGSEDLVLEIGPGLGFITEELAKRAKRVTAVEIDERMRPVLGSLAKKYPNFEPVFANILEWGHFDYDIVCGSLSYAIFEPLLKKLIGRPSFKKGAFIVSKKYMDDHQAGDGLPALMSEAFFRVGFGDILTKDRFYPAPRYPGVIVTLNREDKSDFYHFMLKEIFLQSDKKLKNALREALINWFGRQGKKMTKKEAKTILRPLIDRDESDEGIFQASGPYIGRVKKFLRDYEPRTG